MGQLSGRSCVVTGAARGIGRAIAIGLGREGGHVAVGYSQNEAAAESVVQEVIAAGGDGFALRANVQHPEEVGPAIASVAERFGSIDVLVNNAGITRDRSLAKMSREEWSSVIEVNLHSVFNVTSEVLPHMLRQGYGRIVNISSVVGMHGNFGQANYSTAKAGMIGFTKSAALELAAKGITVNCIAPGFTETDMVLAMPDDVRTRIRDRIPMHRFGKPEEIAQAVLFLVANADYITGQVLPVDGGLYT